MRVTYTRATASLVVIMFPHNVQKYFAYNCNISATRHHTDLEQGAMERGENEADDGLHYSFLGIVV